MDAKGEGMRCEPGLKGVVRRKAGRSNLSLAQDPHAFFLTNVWQADSRFLFHHKTLPLIPNLTCHDLPNLHNTPRRLFAGSLVGNRVKHAAVQCSLTDSIWNKSGSHRV